MPPIAVAIVLSVVAFGIGTSYPVGTVSIQERGVALQSAPPWVR